MNFGKKDDDKGMPLMGGNSFNKKTTGFSVNSFGKASQSLLERIKNLSKRDIAFVLVGLSVLVMAPVAEFFLSKPPTDNLLTPGFGERRNSDGAGPNLYDSGINGMSAGSDMNGEVITPLTSRDPSSLIVGGQQTPPPVVAPPSSSLRDSMKDVAQKSFSEAVKSSPAPFIPPKMNSSLRGFGSFFGEGGGSRTGGNVPGAGIMASAKGASSKSQNKSMVGVGAIPGYRGVSSDSLNRGNKGNMEKLRGQADKAAEFFGGNNAVTALERAGAESPNGGLSGGGLDAAGEDKLKNSKESSLKNSSGGGSAKDVDECANTLANKMKCKRAEMELAWEYEKKKAIWNALFDMAKNFITKGLLDPITTKVAKTTTNMLNPSSGTPGPSNFCWIEANPGKGCAAGAKKGQALSIGYTSNTGQPFWDPPLTEKDCPCGRGESPSEGGSASPQGNPAGGGGTPVDSGDSKSYEENLIQLKKIHDTYKENQAGITPEVIKQTQQLSNSTAQLGAKLAQDLPKKYDAEYTTNMSGLGEVDTKIGESYNSLQDEYNISQKRLNKVLTYLNNPQLLQNDIPQGAQVSEKQAPAKSEVQGKVQEVISNNQATFDSFNSAVYRPYLTLESSAKNFYGNEKGKAGSSSGKLASAYVQLASQAQSFNSNPQAFFPAFLQLSGGTAPAGTGKIYRAAPASSSILSSLVTYRGYDMTKFVANVQPEELVYNMTSDSILPAKCLSGKTAAKDTSTPSADASATAAKTETFSTSPYPQCASFAMNLEKYSEDIVSARVIYGNVNDDVKNLGNFNTMYVAGYMAKFLATLKDNETFLKTYAVGGNAWIKDVLEGKYDNVNPSGGQPTNTQPTNTSPVVVPPVTQPTNTQPTNTQPTNTQPTNTQPTNTQPTNTQPTNTQPTNTKPTQPASTKPQYTTAKSGMDSKVSAAKSDIKKISECEKGNVCKTEYAAAQNAITKMDDVISKFASECSGGKCSVSKINQYKARFEAALTDFNTNYKKALALLEEEKKKVCYKSQYGCTGVSSLYVSRRYLKKAKSEVDMGNLPGYEYDMHNALMKGPKQLYTPQEVEGMCHNIWSDKWLTFGQEGRCPNRHFKETFTLEINPSGSLPPDTEADTFEWKVQNGNDREKTYSGGGAALKYPIRLKVSCAKSESSGQWDIGLIKMLVEKAVMNTSSVGVNASVGPSWGKVGASYAQGQNKTIPYSQEWSVPSIPKGVACGTKLDRVDKVQ